MAPTIGYKWLSGLMAVAILIEGIAIIKEIAELLRCVIVFLMSHILFHVFGAIAIFFIIIPILIGEVLHGDFLK